MNDSRGAQAGDVQVKDVIFQSDRNRRQVLTSYWLIVLLALPLWWSTTSIQRLSLPASRVQAQNSKQFVFPVEININFGALPWDRPQFLGDVKASLREHFRDTEVGNILDFRIRSDSSSANLDYKVTLQKDELGCQVKNRQLIFGTGSQHASEISNDLAITLGALLASNLISNGQETRDQRIVQYSPRYRLAFSLLNEDAASGSAAFGWSVEEAIARDLSPYLSRLAVLHNFTIESQIQLHAPLAFTPNSFQGESGKNEVFGLTQEQLTIFINSADWTLSSSVSNDPVLHFILFVPSAARRPLRILDAKGSPSDSGAFIVPQWGGIIIYNPPSIEKHFHLEISDLNEPFSVFRAQLLALLGVPSLPQGVTASDPLTDWQLDALLRKRALDNIRGSKDTMSSIVKLVNQIEGMPVGKDVQDDVQDALNALDMVYSHSGQSPRLTLHYSSKALSLASRAFFNPGMLAMLYFPAEHKLAVYTPLFAPVCLPLVVGVLREVIAWRKERQGNARGGAAAR